MLLVFAAASVAVSVEGDTTCPTPARVSEVLEPLLAEAAPRSEAHRAVLDENHDGIDVELRSELGRLLGRKTFARVPASCDEMASAIAVTIAAWEAGLASDAPSIDVAVPAPVAPASPTTIAVGGALLGTLDRSGATAGGLGELAIARQRWSARVAAVVTTRKRDDLAPGRVAWARDAIVVGARYRLAGDKLNLAATGDVVLGVLVARGEGFTENRTAYSFDPGVAPGLRATLQRGALGVFVDVCDAIWVRPGRLQVTGVPTITDLPRHEVRLGLGFEIRIVER